MMIFHFMIAKTDTWTPREVINSLGIDILRVNWAWFWLFWQYYFALSIKHLTTYPQWASWSFKGRIDAQIARPNYSGETFSTFKLRFLGMDWKKNRTMNWSVYNLQLAPCTKEEKPFQYICDSVYTLLEFVCLFFLVSWVVAACL